MRLRRGWPVVLALAAACAKVEAPPGGPPDAAPPHIVAVRPESGAVIPDLRDAAEIRFDEVIDEQAGGAQGGGPAGLGRLILLSPVAGDVKVSWHRTTVRIEPKEGWRPGRVYRLELLPGILDLRRNRLDSGRTVLFSTGPPIPATTLRGTALDWTAQRPLAQGVILAARLPDTVPYLARADSVGGFTLGGVPPGDYLVHAVLDENGNRRPDRREAFDSMRVRLDSTADVLLWAFVHDTVGPRLRAADPVDSVTFRLTFTQALDPAAPLDTARVRLYALPDTTPTSLTAVLTPAAYDSLRGRERTAADSARAAERDTAATGAQTPGPSDPRMARFQQRAERPPAPVSGDSATRSRLRVLLAQRPAPTDRVVVRTTAPLAAGARYLVRVRGAVNLNGATADADQVLVMPEPRAPAPGDTAGGGADASRANPSSSEAP